MYQKDKIFKKEINMKIKDIAIRNCVSIIILFIIGQGSLFSQVKNHPYVHPTPGEISILAYSPIPEDMKGTKAMYEDIMKCGFNLVSQMANLDFFKEQFEVMGDLKLKYIISNPVIRTDNKNTLIKSLKGNPHFGGWYFVDEPRFESLENLKKQYDSLYKLDSESFVLVNLVGELVKPFTGDFKTLAAYYDYIQELFYPQMWSFDFYPVIIRNNKLTVQYNQFYSDLEDFYALSKKTGRPFWTTCESMAYTTSSYSRPAPTEASLRFEAFSALAYGAQGIGYWTYSLRKAYGGENYISALVNLKGKKFPAWYAAQKVNMEIKKYNDVFYGCNVREVRHTGDALYHGTHKLSGSFGPFSMIRSGEAGVMVSRIENNGETYIVMVSRDALKKQNVTLVLSNNEKVIDLTSKNKVIDNWKKDIKVTLNPGGYRIYKVLK